MFMICTRSPSTTTLPVNNERSAEKYVNESKQVEDTIASGPIANMTLLTSPGVEFSNL